MKNLLTALFVIVSLNSFAQSTVGVKVGGGQSILESSLPTRKGYTFQAGVIYNYRASKHLLINVEGLFNISDYGVVVNYTNEYGYKDPLLTMAKENKWKSMGMDLPVTLRLNTNGEKANVFVEGGGLVGYWMGQRGMQYSGTNLGWIIGIGSNIMIGKHSIVLLCRYNSPLVKQFNIYKNHTITASVAFMF